MTVWVDGVTTEMTEAELLSEVTYRNYRHNRQRAPDLTPRQWSMLYGGVQTALMERRLKHEQRSAE